MLCCVLGACQGVPDREGWPELLPVIAAEPLVNPTPAVETGDAASIGPLDAAQAGDREENSPRSPLLGLEAFPQEAVPGARRPVRDEGDALARVTTAAWPESLPEFIEVAFGEVLQVPFEYGPSVSEREDRVNFNVFDPLTAGDFLDAVRIVLGDYGLAVIQQNGVYRIVESERFWRSAPDFVVSRSSADTPADLRPVVQIVNLRAMLAGRALQLINRTFPEDPDIMVSALGDQNALVFRGLPDKVRMAVDIVVSLDQPRFSGAIIQSYAPRLWSATALRDRVVEVLNAEGIEVGQRNASNALILYSVPETNEILVFSESRRLSERALYWLRHLDAGAGGGDEARLFLYTVDNTDAASVAQTVNAVLGGAAGLGRRSDAQTGALSPGDAQPGPGRAGPELRSGSLSGGPLVVDVHNNAVLFEGSAVEWQRILPLLRQIDRPAPEVLIEVIVAEVTLSDRNTSGVEWLLNDIDVGDDARLSLGTVGGLGLSGGGLSVTLQGAQARALISAVRESSRVTILSTPRLAARSGGEAQINVGTEVPIITSQRATAVQEGGETQILQSVSYRRTGNILTFSPLVYGSGRIDITISLEVSEAQANPNQAIASPLILNRSVTTQLSLADGSLAIIGGLISASRSDGETGIPGLSQIPGLGRAFRTDSQNTSRSELILMIRPYLIRSADDRSALVDALRSSMRAVDEAMIDDAGQ